MALVTANPLYVEEARARLLAQFKGKPRVRSLLDSYVSQLQEVEDEAIRLRTERALATAVGAQLDGIGALLGVARGERTDDQYRARLRVQVRVNRTDGDAEELLAILGLMLPGKTFVLREFLPAAFELVVTEVLAWTDAGAYDDASDNEFHGTASGGVAIVPSPSGRVFGRAAEFDGIDGKVSATTAVADAISVSVSQYMRLRALAGTNVSTVDTPAISVTGDVEGRADVALLDWTPSSSVALLSKWRESDNNRSLSFTVAAGGALALTLSADGVGFPAVSSTANAPFADLARGRVRFNWRQSDGRVRFYTSTDGVNWTQLGLDRTLAVAGIFDSAAPLEVGSRNQGASLNLPGKVYGAELYSGIPVADGGGGETLVASFKAADATAGQVAPGTVVSSATGETWTLGGLARIVDKDLGPFTLKARLVLKTAGVLQFVAGIAAAGSNRTVTFKITADNKVNFGAVRAHDGVAVGGSGALVLAVDTAHEAAMDYDGSVLRAYLDGVASGSIAGEFAAPEDPTAFTVGLTANDLDPIHAIIDQVYFSRVAEHAGASYTVPAGPLKANQDTVVLYSFDGTPHAPSGDETAGVLRLSRAAGVDGALVWHEFDPPFAFDGYPGGAGFDEGTFATILR